MKPNRNRWAAAVGAVVVGLSLAGDSETLAGHAVQAAAREQLFELGTMVGLRGADGRPTELSALRVEVTQDGGPMWLASRISAAAADDRRFEPVQQPAVAGELASGTLRAELVGSMEAFALRVQLWRRGAGVSPPAPARRRVVPWMIALALALGAAVARLRRSVTAGALATAAMLQALSLWLPWPDNVAAPSLTEALTGGPAALGLVSLARGLSSNGVAVASGVLAACGVLAFFDHRRSRRSGTALGWGAVLSRLAVVFAVGIGLEAALRAGLVSWVLGGWGVLGLFGATLLWAAALAPPPPPPPPGPVPGEGPTSA